MKYLEDRHINLNYNVLVRSFEPIKILYPSECSWRRDASRPRIKVPSPCAAELSFPSPSYETNRVGKVNSGTSRLPRDILGCKKAMIDLAQYTDWLGLGQGWSLFTLHDSSISFCEDYSIQYSHKKGVTLLNSLDWPCFLHGF